VCPILPKSMEECKNPSILKPDVLSKIPYNTEMAQKIGGVSL